MLALLCAALTAVPAPREAVLYQTADGITVQRAQPERGSEPVRGVVEYVVSLASFTLVNAAGSALLSGARVHVAHGSASIDGGAAPLVGAGACFALSPLAAALGSWAVGKGSDAWNPSLGYASLGAYGTSLLALGAGFGMALADVDHDTAVAANSALYLAVPLGTVLLQNATRSPRPQ